MKQYKLSRSLLAAAVPMLAVTVAHAQSFETQLFDGSSKQSSGRVGLAVVSTKRYLGSDEEAIRAFPSIDYRWGNGFFAGFASGVGYRFAAPSDAVQYGLRLSYDRGRKEDRSPALAGLGDIDPSVEGGGFLGVDIGGGFNIRSAVRYGSGNDHDGMLVDLSLGFGTQIAPRWRFGFSVSSTWANKAWTQDYYGITPEQSVRSGYAVYEPEAGLRDARAGLSLTYIITRQWNATVGVSAVQLLGDVKNSPIVRDRNSVDAVIAAGYHF